MNANTSAVGRSLTAPLRLKGGMIAIVHTARHHGRRRNGQLPLFWNRNVPPQNETHPNREADTGDLTGEGLRAILCQRSALSRISEKRRMITA